MPYPKELYAKAQKILEQRRDAAESEAEQRAAEIRSKLPEVDALQQQLARIGLEISQLFFYSGDTKEKLSALRTQSEALVAERTRLLAQNGYKANAMQPERICPVCEDRGFVGGRMCACHKQLLKDLMKREVKQLAPLDKCTFDSFDLGYYSEETTADGIVPRQRAEKVLDAARRYAQNFSANSKNLLFLGKTGLGKTHLSLATANVVISKGFYVCYGTSQNICEDLRAEMFGRDERLTYTKNRVLDCDLLILDDLGTEIENQYNTGTIYNIVNSRILSGKPTIISTNCEFDELLDKYDQRITSRITGEYTKMQLVGTDNRLKK